MKHPITPSFLALGNILKPTYREKVVACALAYYKKGATNDLKQRVNRIFNQRLRIDGFKNAALAPPERFCRQAVPQLSFDLLLSSAITDLWIEANAELALVGRDFIEKFNFIGKNIFAKKDQSIEGWSIEMQEMVAKFKAQYDQYDENDVFLIFSCALKQLFPEIEKMDKEALVLNMEKKPSTENEKPPPENPDDLIQIEDYSKSRLQPNSFHSHLLQHWFEELKMLPADAPEWFELGEFTSALEQLGEEKRARCNQQRLKLQAVGCIAKQQFSIFIFIPVNECGR